MILSHTDEYSLRSIAVLGCNTHSQITVGNVTLPKAVLSTVKIFAVYLTTFISTMLLHFNIKPVLIYIDLKYKHGLQNVILQLTKKFL